ncbi:hypothetical protein EYB31_31035 [Paenibacillus thalictri]|uniref:Metallo-beta-lactamase domain-containing protein n=1 Tax=Paenibacillus thalictri TaxID=2527873 RepID=A0A4V2J3D2_9BACL|nr:hypothetical protein EYB31_31035 [Paenibacillus thalictri]
MPAQHWTRRTLWDTNNSHWGGWVLEKSGDDGASGVGAESGNNLKEAELRSGSSLSVEGTGRVDDGGWKSAEPDYAKRNGQTAEEAGEAGGRSQGAKPAGLTQAGESRKGEDSAGKQTIYFAGDSGYFRGFGLIGERFKPDYTLMPIGAYEPEWFMALQHVTPEEAVQAFLDANGEVMIPMHYGAFRLADDTPKEALDRLYAEWQRRGLPAERLLVPALGETLRF